MSPSRSVSRWLASLAGCVVLSLALSAGSSTLGQGASEAQQLTPGAAVSAVSIPFRLAAGSPPDQPVGTPASAAVADPLDAPASLPIIDFVADPLDVGNAADPLDGDVAEPPLGPGVAEQSYPIARSDRSRDAAGAPLAHDGDPTTIENLDGVRPTVELDLGTVRPIAVVRWLQAEATPVIVQRSLLGGVWVTVDRLDTPEPGVWQTLEVDWPARYLRLRFGRDAAEAAPRLAEVKIYGPAGENDQERRRADRVAAPEVDSAPGQANQDARANDRTNRRDRRSERVQAAQERRERTAQPGQDAAEPGPTDRQPDAAGGVDRVIEGRADVVSEDCGDGTGDCRIEIDVSAGTATCDEDGGSGNRAVGRNASAGEGGTCSRDASGGSVDLGDINP